MPIHLYHQSQQIYLTYKILIEMKQIFSILALVVFGALTVAAQSKSVGPIMTFEKTTIDYGTIDKGGEPHREFKFTNTGDEPLVIKSAKGSCGCTTPSVPEKPIMPGESDVIKVRYDTQRVGGFTKTVTLVTNENSTNAEGKTEDNKTTTVTIKGEVKDVATQEAIPASNGGIKQ
jgi:hypothetical protein